ncbi:hypothetical protein WJX81_003672 [Elliptochloris bilobata]|uniref:Uncharacterized protein n=1 Tax=Elliptochloris bilobata TaxID=381761 RepID=A0AAW1QWJ0_9CHLO
MGKKARAAGRSRGTSAHTCAVEMHKAALVKYKDANEDLVRDCSSYCAYLATNLKKDRDRIREEDPDAFPLGEEDKGLYEHEPDLDGDWLFESEIDSAGDRLYESEPDLLGSEGDGEHELPPL